VQNLVLLRYPKHLIVLATNLDLSHGRLQAQCVQDQKPGLGYTKGEWRRYIDIS
jgi:hypothetical protein